jgi:biotin carboxyl carrier protein
VLVEHGTEVRAGDDLLIIEAMKVRALSLRIKRY